MQLIRPVVWGTGVGHHQRDPGLRPAGSGDTGLQGDQAGLARKQAVVLDWSAKNICVGLSLPLL